MSTATPRTLLEITYEDYAQQYLRRLPPEHFMEATAQATQRKITLESFDLIHAQRSDIQIFNELLVQYPVPGQRKPRQVVPDNMVVVHDQPIQAQTSFNLPLQPVGPFWMLEYVSTYSKRKDYEDNFDRYEQELKVPYYLTFYPDIQELTLYRHGGERYATVLPNGAGRYPVPELEVEVGLQDGWVRFWFRGQLLPLPAELLQEVTEVRRQLVLQQQRADQEQRRAEAAEQRAAIAEARIRELERQLAELRARSDQS